MDGEHQLQAGSRPRFVDGRQKRTVTLQETFGDYGFELYPEITENSGWIETDASTELAAIDYGF